MASIAHSFTPLFNEASEATIGAISAAVAAVQGEGAGKLASTDPANAPPHQVEGPFYCSVSVGCCEGE